MKTLNNQNTISRVVYLLKQNPHFLQNDLANPKIKIIFIDKRKKYTEFYRIVVMDDGFGKDHKRYYWVRIVKNKPSTMIREVLHKQYTLLKKVHVFLNMRKNKKLHFSCSQPILLCQEFRALVTLECSGHLFNNYLQRKIPFLNKNEIKEHCYNIGLWLYLFHQCFRIDTVNNEQIDHYSDRLYRNFGKHPQHRLKFITYCHNDLSPRNIFVEKKSVEVIDFVGVDEGLPEEDIHFFCNYISKARFNFLYSDSLKKLMIEAFLKGYEVGDD